MKKVFLLLALFSTSIYAESYLNFSDYLHSKKTIFKSGQELSQLLKQHGYNLKERDWTKITRLLNGLTKENLASRSSDIEIFLPPKITFQDYLNHKNFRTIASNKKMCKPFQESELRRKFGTDSVTYIKYLKLMTSRKIELRRGDDVSKVIRNDEYSYGSVERGIRLIKHANGLLSPILAVDQTIYLPFCLGNELVREVAAVSEVRTPDPAPASAPASAPIEMNFSEAKVIQTERPFITKWKHSLGLLYGTVDIKRDANELSANFFKLIGKTSYNLEEDVSVTGLIAMNKFFSVSHSQSNETSSPSSVYPEAGIDITKSFSQWRLAVGYDLLNYFLANDLETKVEVEPESVHRLSFKPFLSLTDSFGIFAGVGYLKSFNRSEISGYDLTFGMGTIFGPNKRYNLSAAVYTNDMDTQESSENDVSRAYTLGISYAL